MLAMLISLPVSIGLLIWISRMKKQDPFPKYTFLKLIIAGIIAEILAGLITTIGGVINLLIQIGPEQLALMTDTDSALKILQQIAEANNDLTAQNLLISFIRTFLLIGLAEELMKFFGAKIVMRKPGTANTWMDALLCFAIAAIGFQLFEDMQYASGNIVTAIFRALTPFHFTFAVIMGYFYGMGKVKKSGLYTVFALVVPAWIHTMYDFSINLMTRDENFVVLVLAMNLFLFILTVIAVLQLRRWNREGTLDISI